MKKQIIAVILSAAAALSSVSFASAENDKVEISFKVGDSILSINGVKTEVETPYVAGEGVTLVPLRVITEAFGAEVNWEGETQTITLSYPDVNIVLQINNIIAQVNNHSETLLEAPALSENGVTMVPLRFISETFGADVSYDGATGAILVTKEKLGESQTVVGITEMVRTGDSYYKWSIDTPKQMKMTDRHLDGRSTEFTADDESVMYIDVDTYTKDTLVPFDEKYSDMQSSFSKYTLIEAEKLTDDSSHQYMHFQAKDKDEIIDVREYYGNNYTVYTVISFIKISQDTSITDMILSVMDSFKLGGLDNQTYDLASDVKTENGMTLRTVRDEAYKVSFKIPADYIQSTGSDAENEIRFFSPDKKSNAYVAFSIYSKSADVTAQSLAQKDHDNRIKIMNPEFSTLTDVRSSNDGKYRYSHTVSGSSSSDLYMIDSFFEKGDYVYNISAAVDSRDNESLAEVIISSIQAEELDSSTVGKLLRNELDDTTLATNKAGKFSFQLPVSWKKTSIGASSIVADGTSFLDTKTGSFLAITIGNDSSFTPGGLSDAINSYKKYMMQDKNNKIVKDIDYTSIDRERFAHFTYQMKSDDGEIGYITAYMKTYSGEMILFALYEPDVYYHKDGNETLMNALSSLTRN